MGSVLAQDSILNGVNILLAPGINIKRVAVCGRNFEYISEDPYLTGTLAKEYIQALQERGIAATVKHFCANNREYARFTVSSEVDERTLREVYLSAFEIALEADPWLVMCSYNPVNGWYTSENRWLLHDVLREEFGFGGVIVSDWCAVHDRAKSLKATLDLEMPYAERSEQNLKDALARGFITEREIDESVERLLQLFDKIEASAHLRKVDASEEERHAAAVRICEEGIVLLKNDEGILPLADSAKTIAVIGEQAKKPEMGGGGSSTMTGYCEFQPESLAKLLSDYLPESEIRYCGGYNVISFIGHRYREWLGKTAVKTAYESDLAIVCVGTNYTLESECFDRETLRLPKVQEDILEKVLSVNENVIVVVTAGSCVDMSPWKDRVKAIVYTGFGGEGGNEAIADILTGRVCPSGKLSETFIRSINDNPNNSETGNGFVEKYNDGVLVGYKYYEHYKIPVQFPFGFGLSYAKFEYFDLSVRKLSETEYLVEYSIKNVSSVPGKEISQVYVKDVFSMVEQPPKALKAFEKTALAPGESKRVRHVLNERAFSYYSVVQKKWYVENGWFEIMVGASCEDIRLKEKIYIQTDEDGQNSKYDDYYLNMF